MTDAAQDAAQHAAIWTNAQSTRASLEGAIDEVVERTTADLDGRSPTFGLIFVSAAFASEFSRVLPLLREKMELPALIGCGSNGVVGVNDDGAVRELEDGPAVSLTVAHLPGVQAETFQVAGDALPSLDGAPDDWVTFVGIDPARNPQFVVLIDPFSQNIVDLLQGLDYAYPGMPKVGGIASGVRPGENNPGLFVTNVADGRGVRSGMVKGGAVGLALTGNVTLETVVAQGCRPIGPTFRVVDGQRNIISQVEPCTADVQRDEVAVTSPLEALQSLLETLSDEDRTLAKYELFIGLVRDEFKLTLSNGDFLIRNLMGVDPRSGAVAIADRVRPGQRVQFHLRDARASREDLENLLEASRREYSGQPPIGALMFACLGRGKGLYNAPDFDTGLLNGYYREMPIGGCFCNGEIGPVGGSTFLHGYTSVFGLCRLGTDGSSPRL